MQPPQERIHELDSLRGLAAVAVVLFHYTTRFEELFGHTAEIAFRAPWGQYGVDFFLILSGLMILRSLDRSPSAIGFAIGRFARLYPAYWAAAALTFSAIAICGLPGQEVSVRDAWLNLSMLQQLVGARHIDGAYWSLQVEVLFYGGILVMHRSGAFCNERRLYLAVACWLAIAALYHCLLACPNANPTAVKLVRKACPILSLRYAHLFAAGIVLYQVRRCGRVCPQALVMGISCVVIQASVDCWQAAAFIVITAILIFLAAAGRFRWLQARILVYLGTISYPLYLVHQNLGYIVIRELESRSIAPEMAVLAALSLSLMVAGGLAFGVERPAHYWLKSRLQALAKRFEAPCPATSASA